MSEKSISVIMPSFLQDYLGASKGREMKFIRAINSFLENNYENKQLLIVSDGCSLTKEIYERHKDKWENVKLFYIPKQELFSGKVREFGLGQVDTDYVCYLDTDDVIGKTHLHNIVLRMNETGSDWVFFNDKVKNKIGERWSDFPVRITELRYGKCGTSTIAHKARFPNGYIPSWEGCDGYGHDYHFIKRMIDKSAKFQKIQGCSYYVCHLKGTDIDF